MIEIKHGCNSTFDISDCAKRPTSSNNNQDLLQNIICNKEKDKTMANPSTHFESDPSMIGGQNAASGTPYGGYGTLYSTAMNNNIGFNTSAHHHHPHHPHHQQQQQQQ